MDSLEEVTAPFRRDSLLHHPPQSHQQCICILSIANECKSQSHRAMHCGRMSSSTSTAHFTCKTLRVLVPDQYSARPSSFFPSCGVTACEFLEHAPQLVKLEINGCHLNRHVHPALLSHTRRVFEGEEDELNLHDNEDANKSRMGRSGEAFRWNKTLAAKMKATRDPFASACPAAFCGLRPSPRRPAIMQTTSRSESPHSRKHFAFIRHSDAQTDDSIASASVVAAHAFSHEQSALARCCSTPCNQRHSVQITV